MGRELLIGERPFSADDRFQREQLECLIVARLLVVRLSVHEHLAAARRAKYEAKLAAAKAEEDKRKAEEAARLERERREREEDERRRAADEERMRREEETRQKREAERAARELARARAAVGNDKLTLPDGRELRGKIVALAGDVVVFQWMDSEGETHKRTFKAGSYKAVRKDAYRPSIPD